MENLEKYKKCFVDLLGVSGDKVEGLHYQDVDTWDSVGHMTLMSEIEEVFGIEMDADDIIDFDSYESGKKILSEHYGVKF